ncbi:MAG: aldolase/citrate lyase family protein [Bryobacteraceae bacterium]
MRSKWEALARGERLIGSFLSTGYPVNAELVGMAGFDFVIIDLEHGMSAERDILGQLHALETTGTTGLVRVESHEKQRVHRILDLGAKGIMFPRVESADQARACVAAMRYPPRGVRGVATMIRASGYGRDYEGYRDSSEAELITILQIESAEGVRNVEQIAAVEGAGVLFIGPMDLSTSLGVFRQYDHPLFVDAVEKTVSAAKRHGRPLGILLGSPADLPRWDALGFRMITCGTDTLLIKKAAAEMAAALRG